MYDPFSIFTNFLNTFVNAGTQDINNIKLYAESHPRTYPTNSNTIDNYLTAETKYWQNFTSNLQQMHIQPVTSIPWNFNTRTNNGGARP